MNQSRLGSLIEALFNVLIGFFISFAGQLVILPMAGVHNVSLNQNLFIGACFTVISVARTYVIRRWFNARLHTAALRLAEKYNT